VEADNPKKVVPQEKAKKEVPVKQPKKSFFDFLKKKKAPEVESKPLFGISGEGNIPDIPEVKEIMQVNVKYPLIEPYAYAHVSWDANNSELVYNVEEPVLSESEKEVLKQIEYGIKELINISFVNIKEDEVVIEYLEKNVKVLLNEFNIKLSKESFLKIMYYIYRNFVGLNEIEPLLKDFYIEDIECNGVNTPIYLVHRKFRQIRTNVIFKDVRELTSLVEKIAQKTGSYVSYSNPLLDSVLPDGSRVNATYTKDITSKGPTFTIRKFTKDPFTPIKLMSFGSVSPEILAYLWLLTEYGANIMVIGGTGSGKTSFLNSIAFFIPPQKRVVTIEDSVTGDTEILIKKQDKIQVLPIKEFIKYNRQKTDAEVLTLGGNHKLRFARPTLLLKHKTKKNIYKITTATGRIIKVTEDHSLFTLGDNGLKEIKPKELLNKKSFIAVPRAIPYEGNECKYINLLEHLEVFKDDFLIGRPVQKILKRYDYKKFGIKKSRYRWWKSQNLIKIDELLKIKFEFEEDDLKELRIKSRMQTSLPVLFEVTKEFLELVGLWIGDGSYDGYNKNRVIISNSDKECIELVKRFAKQNGFYLSLMNDKISFTINSTVFYKFMREIVGLRGHSATKRIPNFIQNLSNEQINHVIRGYFSADGGVKKYEVACASQSLGLLHDLQTLFLRLGIISRISDFDRKDKCMNLSISSYKNIAKFKQIKFLQLRKNKKLDDIRRIRAHSPHTDIIPLSISQLKEINKYGGVPNRYFKGLQSISRGNLQKIAPKGSLFNDMSHSDILWDKIKKIEKLNPRERYVYDIGISGTEKFVGANVLLHNTREIRLMHENWLPAVARGGVGAANLMGYKHGEVTLFDLLKASFRQRPDYVIVGEVRGKEAFVLFQGAASGHPTASTMHAESVETLIKRLETNPINLSPSLVEELDIVCVMIQTEVGNKAVRRLSTISEIVSVGEGGKVVTNTPFARDPAKDVFYFKKESHVLNEISKRYGIPIGKLMEEFDIRSKVLMQMYRKGIFNFEQVQRIINEYYRNPREVLRKLGLIA